MCPLTRHLTPRPRPGRRRAVLILLLGNADARKQLRQGSCVPTPSAQHERATNVRVRRDSRESKRARIRVGSPPILKRTTHPSRSPLRQAEVVHTAHSQLTNIDTSTDWYDNSPRVEQAPSSR
eukprot:scaffold7574_cov144-Isochrysis_galbana.AAC.1